MMAIDLGAPKMKAPDISKGLFGAVLDTDGAGHYPGLELINFVVCGTDGLLDSQAGQVHLKRVAHDYARKLSTNELQENEKKSVLLNEHTETAVRHLLKCLELETPNTVKSKSWERTHFFPYSPSLVHWDARRRKREKRVDDQREEIILIERRYYRGAGAYAYKVLRKDPDAKRLESIREGFQALYPDDSASPLEILAKTLRSHGKIDEGASADQIEIESRLLNDHWEDLYRDGICNILGHAASPLVQRVRAVMNWTSIWLALAQADRASKAAGGAGLALVVDCSGAHPQLRRAAQKCLSDHQTLIDQVSRAWITAQGQTAVEGQIRKVRGFFANTAAAGGMLNAWKGRRHFTLKLQAIEALVLAAVGPSQELEYEIFLSQWLFKRCHIVAGREAASDAGLLTAFDATIFEENERRLAEHMRDAGMLRVFSDATRMVSPGGNQ